MVLRIRSNLDPDRFRERVGDWLERNRATLRDHELRFSGEVHSEGGGGAIIHQAHGKQVHGGVYKITRDQVEAMDRNELQDDHDPEHRGTRCTITAECPSGPREAEIYLVPRPRTYEAPSDEYLGHILTGLRSLDYEESLIREVQAAATHEPH